MARTSKKTNFKLINSRNVSETSFNATDGKVIASTNNRERTYLRVGEGVKPFTLHALLPADGKSMTLSVPGTDISETVQAGFGPFIEDNMDGNAEGYGSMLPADKVQVAQAAWLFRSDPKKYASLDAALEVIKKGS